MESINKQNEGFLFSNKVDRRSLQAGDHIYTWRGLTYCHHGVYIGDDKVIHYGRGFVAGPESTKINSILNTVQSRFSSAVPRPSTPCTKCSPAPITDGVTKSCLDCFLDGCSLYRYAYGVSKTCFISKRNGTCTMVECNDSPGEVLHRAKHLLKYRTGFGPYHVLTNNCEDFAFYCKTGIIKLTVEGSRQANGFFGKLLRTSKDDENTERRARVEDLVRMNSSADLVRGSSLS